ncbi:MAG: toll/interleukin-1 receptor domain-containing protein [Alphaproteobacteria bacterium]
MSGLESDSVRVFVSHKDEDRDIARTIKDLLEKFAPNRLEFFISGENIIAGEDWQERIRGELRKSRLLLLLFTEPTKNWDWCLFEAGLFTPLLTDDARRRIVCFYPLDSDGPRPLTNLQGVEASVESMSTFLEQFFRSDAITQLTPPLNDKLSSDDINDVANKICALFGPQKIDAYFPSFRLMLQIPRNIELKKNTIPRQAKVTGDASALAIFGLGPGAHSWGDLVNNVGRHGLSDWVEEIGTAFNMASRRHLFPPMTATFHAVDSGKIFRPFLYQLDLELDRPVAAVIAFTEELTPPDVGGPMFRLLSVSPETL